MQILARVKFNTFAMRLDKMDNTTQCALWSRLFHKQFCDCHGNQNAILTFTSSSDFQDFLHQGPDGRKEWQLAPPLDYPLLSLSLPLFLYLHTA